MGRPKKEISQRRYLLIDSRRRFFSRSVGLCSKRVKVLSNCILCIINSTPIDHWPTDKAELPQQIYVKRSAASEPGTLRDECGFSPENFECSTECSRQTDRRNSHESHQSGFVSFRAMLWSRKTPKPKRKKQKKKQKFTVSRRVEALYEVESRTVCVLSLFSRRDQ